MHHLSSMRDKMIYWDHNATTPCALEVIEAMRPYWNEEYGNPASAHLMGRRAIAAVKKAREQVAALVHCHPAEIIFTSGATESNNLLFLGILLTPQIERKRIVVSAIEHKSVLEPARLLGERGFEVVRLPVDHTGVVDIAAARDLITQDTLLVSVQAANNELGTLQPIAQLADLAHENGAFFHTDAAQFLGRLPFDAQTLSCDFASFSAHKMYGPKGIGALFVRSGARRWPWTRPFRGGGQEMDLRPGTLNVPAIVGFGEACLISQRYIEKDYQVTINQLEKLLISLLKETFPKIVWHSAGVARLPGVMSISFPDSKIDLIVDNLPDLIVGKGAACSNMTIGFSHVLDQIGYDNELAKNTIRISLGREVVRDDIYIAVEILKKSLAEVQTSLR